MSRLKRKRIFSKAAGRKKPSRFSGNLIVFLVAFIVFVVLIVQFTLKPLGKFSFFGGAESGYWIKIFGSGEGFCRWIPLQTNLPDGTMIYVDWKTTRDDIPFELSAEHPVEEGSTTITNPEYLHDPDIWNPLADCQGWLRFKDIEGLPYQVRNTDGKWKKIVVNEDSWWKWWKAVDLEYTEGPYFDSYTNTWETYAGFKLLSCSLIRHDALEIEFDDGRVTWSNTVGPGVVGGGPGCRFLAFIPANVQKIKVGRGFDPDNMLVVTSSSPDWEKEGEWLVRTRTVVIPTGSPTPVERPTSAPTLTPTLTPRPTLTPTPTRSLKFPVGPTGRLPSPGIKY